MELKATIVENPHTTRKQSMERDQSSRQEQAPKHHSAGQEQSQGIATWAVGKERGSDEPSERIARRAVEDGHSPFTPQGRSLGHDMG
jgi:hypothetical protein